MESKGTRAPIRIVLADDHPAILPETPTWSSSGLASDLVGAISEASAERQFVHRPSNYRKYVQITHLKHEESYEQRTTTTRSSAGLWRYGRLIL